MLITTRKTGIITRRMPTDILKMLMDIHKTVITILRTLMDIHKTVITMRRTLIVTLYRQQVWLRVLAL
jgi:hypothetical protein